MSGDLSPTPMLCPVCRARFRGTSHCSRCGADLLPLLTQIARAHHAHRAAAAALCSGQLDTAHSLALRARTYHSNPTTRRLATLTELLTRRAER